MKKTISAFLALAMLVNFVGCANTGLTPLQKRILESKELEGSFDNALGSAVYILQDKGYMIKSSDRAAGLIYAELSTQVMARPAPGWLLLYVVPYIILLLGKVNYTYRATINFEKITETRVKLRLSISGIFDNRLTESVEDPKIYQDFYAEIQKEMFRRAQLNK